MSDLISKQAVLEWLAVEIDLSSGNDPVSRADKWAFQSVRQAIKRGKFDAQPDSEVQRLREALDIIAAYDGDFLSGEDAKEMRSIARSISSPQKGETPDDTH